MKFFIIFFIIINLFDSGLKASEETIEKLKAGKKIVFIRHALAPGGGDPENFDLKNVKHKEI